MRAFVITGPGQAEVAEVPTPVAGPGEVVVGIERVGVCGTDVAFFTGEMPFLHDGNARYPMRIGHEWMGTVLSVGSSQDEGWLGQRVTGDTMLGCRKCVRCESGRQHLCDARLEVGVRGGKDGPNYDAASIETTLGLLRGAKLAERVMIDTSHGNSGKDYRRQPEVARSVGEQVAEGQRGIIGLLMESFLVDGAQKVVPGQELVFGQSVTDSCMGWEMTLPVLEGLAEAVRTRRRLAN